MKNEQEYIILQIQEDDYGCEERPAGAKKTVFVRLKDAKENERMIRLDDEWIFVLGFVDGDVVVLTENHLYKKMEER